MYCTLWEIRIVEVVGSLLLVRSNLDLIHQRRSASILRSPAARTNSAKCLSSPPIYPREGYTLEARQVQRAIIKVFIIVTRE